MEALYQLSYSPNSFKASVKTNDINDIDDIVENLAAEEIRFRLRLGSQIAKIALVPLEPKTAPGQPTLQNGH